MTTSPADSTGVTLLVLELGLTLITIGLSLSLPALGDGFLERFEKLLSYLPRGRATSIVICGALPCLVRLMILPIDPIPHPWIQDDFSFLLAAETYASGRLTNPTPPMWMHFESFHITMKPTYMSMYFPAQGMIMAAGRLLAGHPWFGVWASCGLMCAALCWALQGWVPSRWALLGALIAGMRLALFSYWMDTYTGGAMAATGGALVIGAVPRIQKCSRARDFFWLALGMAILANSRPYEGALVCIGAVSVIAWSWWKRRRPPVALLMRRALPAATLLAGTLVFMGYYNHRLFGNALTLPYTINRETYAVAQHFVWQRARPEPAYRHVAMRNFYASTDKLAETNWFFKEQRSLQGFLEIAAVKLVVGTLFFLNFALLPLLIGLPRVFRDKRMRPVILMAAVFLGGLAVETWFIPHYGAPAVALLYIVLVQCLRHLRASGAAGLFLARAIPILCAILVVIRIFAPLNLPDDLRATQTWYGSRPIGLERAGVVSRLESEPGGQLAIVRYLPDHIYPEWVYNAAEIERSKIVWAREMAPAQNRELLQYFRNRTAWLIEPDAKPPRVTRYIVPGDPAAKPVSLAQK